MKCSFLLLPKYGIKMAKLSKNQKINLTKASDKLSKVKVVLGWQTPENVIPKYDLDVTAFLLGSDQKLISEEGIIFYGSPELKLANGSIVNGAPDLSVWKTPDEREGGIEELYIDIPKLNSAIVEISIVVTIHKAKVRRQSFKDVKNAFLQIYNDETNELLADFPLTDIPGNNTAIHVGSFYQTDEGFVFQGLAAGYELDLADFVVGYGGEVE